MFLIVFLIIDIIIFIVIKEVNVIMFLCLLNFGNCFIEIDVYNNKINDEYEINIIIINNKIFKKFLEIYLKLVLNKFKILGSKILEVLKSIRILKVNIVIIKLSIVYISVVIYLDNISELVLIGRVNIK